MQISGVNFNQNTDNTTYLINSMGLPDKQESQNIFPGNNSIKKMSSPGLITPGKEEMEWLKQMPKKPKTEEFQAHNKYIKEQINAWRNENPAPVNGSTKDFIEWANNQNAQLEKLESEYRENNPEYAKQADEYNEAVEKWQNEKPQQKQIYDNNIYIA